MEIVTQEYLPLFAYGTLRDSFIYTVIGKRAVQSFRLATAYDIEVGIGDLYPCADRKTGASTVGVAFNLTEHLYERSLSLLDEYEGVESGFYTRGTTPISSAESTAKEMGWIYLRGIMLGGEQI